jgi:biopolymer transport protein ExbD
VSAALVLEVRAEGFALNRSPVLALDGLGKRLRAAFDTRGDGTLFVRVEEGVPYERVVDALDTAQAAGASRIGLVEDEAAGS